MRFVLAILATFTPLSAFAQSDFLADFLVGNYLLVGKAPDSEKTYTGRVEIYREDDNLKFRRSIMGKVVTGDAQLESAPAGETQVLRVRFQEAGIDYDETCLWQSDLDNYARISCYLYRHNVRTQDPGLEVLFHDHMSDRTKPLAVKNHTDTTSMHW